MVTVGDLQARVASHYERLDLPTWPDPHPGMAPPRDEEYSRLTDPGRYRILHARARAWAVVLEEALAARPEALVPDRRAVADSDAFDRGVRVVPRRPGGLPLLFLERDVPTQQGEATLPSLTIAIERQDVVVERQPDCGCDACDSGSNDLLDAVDAAVRHVVGGPFVVLRGRNWHAHWYPGGGSASSSGSKPPFRTLMDWCRRMAEGETVPVPDGTESLVSHGWIG